MASRKQARPDDCRDEDVLDLAFGGGFAGAERLSGSVERPDGRQAASRVVDPHARLRQQAKNVFEYVAVLVRLSYAMVNRWERGHCKPSVLACQRIRELEKSGVI